LLVKRSMLRRVSSSATAFDTFESRAPRQTAASVPFPVGRHHFACNSVSLANSFPFAAVA
jgi:hypothetical protein